MLNECSTEASLIALLILLMRLPLWVRVDGNSIIIHNKKYWLRNVAMSKLIEHETVVGSNTLYNRNLENNLLFFLETVFFGS